MADEIKKENESNGEKKEIGIEDELGRCRAEKSEYLDGWKRAKADLMNYKKEEAKRFEEVVKFSREGLVRELINVLDSFDLALVSLDGAEEKIKKGMYLIRGQLEDILKKSGLEKIAVSAGQPFNPAFQEVIVSVESDKPSGMVVEEVEKGYMFNGKIIRPARVKVAK